MAQNLNKYNANEAASKFIPDVFAAGVEKELEHQYVTVQLCNKEYEGLIKNQGDSVTFRMLGEITAHGMTRANRRDDLIGAEVIEGSKVTMNINQIVYTVVGVDGIDELATDIKTRDKYAAKTAKAIKIYQDTYVNELAFTKGTVIQDGNNAIWNLDVDNIIDLVLTAKARAKKLGLSPDDLVWVIDPDVEMLIDKAGLVNQTDNNSVFKNGYKGKISGIDVLVSDNLYDDGTYETEDVLDIKGNALKDSTGANVKRYKLEHGLKKETSDSNKTFTATFMTTKEDILFAQQIQDVVTYREDGKYLNMDFIKTWGLFDADIIHPERVFVYKVGDVNIKTVGKALKSSS